MGRGLRKRGSREGRRTFEEQKGKARGRMGLGKKETEKGKREGVVGTKILRNVKLLPASHFSSGGKEKTSPLSISHFSKKSSVWE